MGDLSANFSWHEFICRCGCDPGLAEIDRTLLEKLQTLRDFYKHPIANFGGYRCAKHNAAVGGSPKSHHLTGSAVDIPWPSGAHLRYRLVELAFMVKFSGIGIYDGHIHLDTGDRPQPVMWVGKSNNSRHLSIVPKPPDDVA